MLQKLTGQQTQWVDTTLNSLSLEQCVGQLLCISQFRLAKDDWLRLIEEKQIGSMRARAKSAQAYRELLLETQKRSPIPLLVPANMEFGAAELRGYGTAFPPQMGAGAADDDTPDPQIMIDWSDDGGHTWTQERWVSAGLVGEFERRAIVRRLGRSRNRIYRVTVSDPVKWAFVDAYLTAAKGTS